jgi:aminoglycoside phosphotransferase (APT) family kinase protein
MMDFASTQAQAKEVAPSAAKPPSTSPPLTADGVDKMYHQLAEIHAIPTAQLAECAHWCWSDSTPSPVWAGTDR